MTADFRDRAQRFADLHTAREVLVVCNVWDVGSAKLLAASPKVAALGTSSAAVAATRGVADGERLAAGETIEAAGAMAQAIDKPLTLDLEAGYADTPEQVNRNVARTLQAGCSGFNIEDTDPATGQLRDPGHQAELVRAAADAVAEHNPHAVLNARTDTFWNGIGDSDAERMAETTRRLDRYRDAGATCLFVPGYPALPERVAELVAACAGVPLNLLAGGGWPFGLAELAELGVARVSYGSGLYRAVMAEAIGIVESIATSGSFKPLGKADELTYPELKEKVGA
jgi:2-methylisocitrate lyase-like PEP mutase family enzyme